MRSVKRLEIIVEAVELRELQRVLARLGVDSYSVVHNVTGKSASGVQSGDDLSDVFRNVLLLTTCAPEELDEIVGALRPLLQRRGGICLVSDAQWLIH